MSVQPTHSGVQFFFIPFSLNISFQTFLQRKKKILGKVCDEPPKGKEEGVGYLEERGGIEDQGRMDEEDGRGWG